MPAEILMSKVVEIYRLEVWLERTVKFWLEEKEKNNTSYMGSLHRAHQASELELVTDKASALGLMGRFHWSWGRS